VAVTADQATRGRGTAPGNLAGTSCGHFRLGYPPRGHVAGQVGEQTAPSFPRHTRENQGVSRPGREGRRLGRRWRRSPILGMLPVVLLATAAGAVPFAHLRDTTAEHAQYKPTSGAAACTSTEKERNTTRPARSNRPAGEHTARRSSPQPPSGRDLRSWAASLAAALPPLTEPQVAAVARLAACLDADDSQESAA